MNNLLRVLLIFTVVLLTACSKEYRPYHEQGYIFGTLVDVTVYGENDLHARRSVSAVMHELQRLHDMLHAWQPSELSQLNDALARGERRVVSAELAKMLNEAAQLSLQSQGLFNPAIGELVQVWGFHADEFKAVLPDESRISTLLETNPQMSDLVISSLSKRPASPTPLNQTEARTKDIALRVESTKQPLEPIFDKPSAEHFNNGGTIAADAVQGLAERVVSSRNAAVRLDLGGYAKGYALDRSAALLRQQGIHNALVNIGGNILALGKHGTRPWRVGIQHPRKSGALALLDLHDGEAIGTSGDYQRYFMLGNRRYCHLIDPRTGYPAQGAQAATVLTHGARAGVLSDMASKPLFISGTQGWRAAASRMNLSYAMLVDNEGNIHLTADLQKRIKFADENIKPHIE